MNEPTDASASVAGVSAASDPLEVVAWEYETGSFISARAKQANAESTWANFYTKPLADHADAQSRIASLTAQVESMRADKAKACHIALKKSAENECLTADLAEARAESDRLTGERDDLLNDNMARLLAAINETDSARWEVGFRNIVAALHNGRHAFEIVDIVEEVRALKAAATAPRVPLTDEVIMELAGDPDTSNAFEEDQDRREMVGFARAIEAAHGISAIPGDDAKAVGGEASRG